MKMIILITELVMTQLLSPCADDFGEYLKRVVKRDIETKAILHCEASEATLKQHPGFRGFFNTEIRLDGSHIEFHNYRDFMTGRIEEFIRVPASDKRAQLELKRYKNLSSLLSIDAERKRLKVRRRILVHSDFRLDAGASMKTVLKLFPQEKRLVTQAAAQLT